MPSPIDQLLTLGRRLEQAGLAQFTKKTPSGDLALYRMHRVQLLRQEADEVDTGGSCILFFTPEAPGLSGLLIECATVLGALPEGKTRAETYCKRVATQLVSHRKKAAGTWETAAAKDAVSLALKVAEEPIAPTNNRRPSGLLGDAAMEHFFEAEPGVFRMNQEGIDEINREMQRRWGARGRQHRHGATAGRPERQDGQWLTISGVDGVVAGKAWIPLLKTGERISEARARAILKAVTKAGFSSEITALVLKYHG